MATYGIDIVFKSDIETTQNQTPTDPNPIAMAFGYSYLPDDAPESEKGEQGKRRIKTSSNIQFWLFDLNTTISPAQQVNEVSIQFRNQAQDSTSCPFKDWDNGGKTFTSEDKFNPNPISGPTPRDSVGTNIKGAQGYILGKSTTADQSASYPAINSGKYEFTVKVTLNNGLLFQVDPEVDIEGVG